MKKWSLFILAGIFLLENSLASKPQENKNEKQDVQQLANFPKPDQELSIKQTQKLVDFMKSVDAKDNKKAVELGQKCPEMFDYTFNGVPLLHFVLLKRRDFYERARLVKLFVEYCGVDVNKVDLNGEGFLHQFVKQGDIWGASALMNFAVLNYQQKNNNGQTAEDVLIELDKRDSNSDDNLFFFDREKIKIPPKILEMQNEDFNSLYRAIYFNIPCKVGKIWRKIGSSIMNSSATQAGNNTMGMFRIFCKTFLESVPPADRYKLWTSLYYGRVPIKVIINLLSKDGELYKWDYAHNYRLLDMIFDDYLDAKKAGIEDKNLESLMTVLITQLKWYLRSDRLLEAAVDDDSNIFDLVYRNLDSSQKCDFFGRIKRVKTQNTAVVYDRIINGVVTEDDIRSYLNSGFSFFASASVRDMLERILAIKESGNLLLTKSIEEWQSFINSRGITNFYEADVTYLTDLVSLQLSIIKDKSAKEKIGQTEEYQDLQAKLSFLEQLPRK